MRYESKKKRVLFNFIGGTSTFIGTEAQIFHFERVSKLLPLHINHFSGVSIDECMSLNDQIQANLSSSYTCLGIFFLKDNCIDGSLHYTRR